MPVCNDCGTKTAYENFNKSPRPEHDLQCATCGSNNVNTSDVLAEVENYEYGDANTRPLESDPQPVKESDPDPELDPEADSAQ